ncbi:MAG TPA: S9 family peptidase [Caulobacteraceae bacterium]|jgi:dipeptidyl aminopeptidase/acylaminoacyl peptidase
MKTWAVALCALAIMSGAAATAADGPARLFTPHDLFELQFAADPQVRPDGREIAYVRVGFDAMSDRARRAIWLIDVQSGAQRPLGAGTASAPRYSPGGDRLAYLSADETGHPQLWVRWLTSGASAKLADLPSAPGSIAWSPDGHQIAFAMLVEAPDITLGAPLSKPEGAKWAEPLKIISRLHYREDGEGYLKPGYRQLFVIAADGGAPRQLTFGAYDVSGPISWTPDGRTLIFASGREKGAELDPLAARIWALNVAGGSLTPLTGQHGPSGDPVVSPDGRLIAWAGFTDRGRGYENAQLWVMDRDGANLRSLTAGLDRSVARPQWASDGRSIFFAYGDRGVTKIGRVDLAGRMQTVAAGLGGSEPDRPYNGGAFSSGGGGVVAFTLGDAGHPADVGLARQGAVRRLTDLNAGLFAGKTLARVEPLAVTSSFDERPIDAWIMTPPDFDPTRKYPLILEIHGGPFAAYGPSFASELQLYAAAGYVVVYANPRGSTSYGAAFANLIDKNYPSQDYDDLMSVVDAAIARGSVDANNLFVTGGSGGGLLTAWIVGKTDRFRAAAAQKPVIDWTSEVLTVDLYAFMARYWFGKMPWEDPDFYWRRSPLSLVGHVATPTLVMVGEEDHRTPPSEAEQFFQALQLRQVPTVLVRVPGASHEGLADRPSQEAAEAAAILAWFNRYRVGGAASS